MNLDKVPHFSMFEELIHHMYIVIHNLNENSYLQENQQELIVHFQKLHILINQMEHNN